jgi:hypothetical protein
MPVCPGLRVPVCICPGLKNASLCVCPALKNASLCVCPDLRYACHCLQWSEECRMPVSACLSLKNASLRLPWSKSASLRLPWSEECQSVCKECLPVSAPLYSPHFCGLLRILLSVPTHRKKGGRVLKGEGGGGRGCSS